MTQDEIIEIAQECRLIGMRPHLDGIYSEALVAFAKLVAEKTLAEHAMSKVQRLGQEIEQERTWVGLNDDEIDYLIHLAYTGDEEFVQTIEAKLKEKNT